MNRTLLASAWTAALACSAAAGAASLDDELAAIKARLSALEQQVREQNAVIRAKDREIAELRDASRATDSDRWVDAVEVGGVIEVEASHASPYRGDSESDIVVATVEVGIAAQINDWTAGEIVLLYEEDDSDLDVDVATITIADPHSSWFVTAGRQYVPFGSYETKLLSDPLTLELGETSETALLAGIAGESLHAAVYVFNGDNKESADDRIDNYGARAGFAHRDGDRELAANLGYINDIGDSDALQDAINGNLGNNDVAEHVAGWSVDAMLRSGPFVVIGEYLRADDRFAVAELPFDGRGARPQAFNLEAGYDFNLAGRDATAAIAYQGTDQALALELPKTRILAAVSVAVVDNTTVTLELARDRDYGRSDGGSGEHATTATAQLAVEF